MSKEILINTRKSGHVVALVDDEDYERIIKLKWNLGGDKGWLYAQGRWVEDGILKTIVMHRFVMNAAPGQIVDHINGNRLDNRKANLRFATNSENLRNRLRLNKLNVSGFHGVSWNKTNHNWRAVIGHHNHVHHIGCFKDPAEAARAYDEAAKRLHGEFATLNFPDVEAA